MSKRGSYRTTLANGNVAFSKAINAITRKGSEAKALPLFKTLLRGEIASLRRATFGDASDENVERILGDNLECFRRDGMPPGMVESLAAKYAALPRRGTRSRKKV